MFTTISRERRELRQAKIFAPKVTIIEAAVLIGISVTVMSGGAGKDEE